jgi:hypothetical protein
MKLVPRDPNTQTASYPKRSSELDPQLAAIVRGVPSDPNVPARSGINDDLDLGRAFNKALAAQAGSPLPVASNVAAEDAERRRQLMDSIRVKSSSMTMVAGQSALTGMLWGGLAGTGILLMRCWLHGGGHDD